MVMVCEKDFPKGSRPYQQKAGFYMDKTLKQQIDYLLKNIVHDWDFTIIISGKGNVRVGKSVLGMQIGYYWTQQMKELYGIDVPFNLKENFVFHGSKLISKGNELGSKYKYFSLIFDEAGADLQGRRVMRTTTQAVLDYLRECGQYNALTILILPEFFDLPKSVAISRSIFLLNVDYTASEEGDFQRGLVNFYSKPKKKKLYIKGKKDLDYAAASESFICNFKNFYPLSEQEYRELKLKALRTRDLTLPRHEMRMLEVLQCLFTWFKSIGKSQQDIADIVNSYSNTKIEQQWVSWVLKRDYGKLK